MNEEIAKLQKKSKNDDETIEQLMKEGSNLMKKVCKLEENSKKNKQKIREHESTIASLKKKLADQQKELEEKCRLLDEHASQVNEKSGIIQQIQRVSSATSLELKEKTEQLSSFKEKESLLKVCILLRI